MAKRWARVMVGGLVVLAAAFSALADARWVDIELVSAVDSSTSVDFDEFNLQVRGLAAAFRDPTVVAAVADGPARVGRRPRLAAFDAALRAVKQVRNARFKGGVRGIVVLKRMRLRAALAVYAPGGAGFLRSHLRSTFMFSFFPYKKSSIATRFSVTQCLDCMQSPLFISLSFVVGTSFYLRVGRVPPRPPPTGSG